MTVITLIVAEDMIRRLAPGLYTIVATGAAANYLGVIYARDRAPGCFPVTVFALIGTENVIHRYRSRFDQTGAGVTA